MKTTTVNVMGVTYTVLLGTKEELNMCCENMGECDIYEKTIKVFDGKLDSDESDLSVELRVKEIIQHELGHAFIHECGMSVDCDVEEMICTFLEVNLRKMMNCALSVMDDFNLE